MGLEEGNSTIFKKEGRQGIAQMITIMKLKTELIDLKRAVWQGGNYGRMDF
ncbi:MAG: hypothetical protein AB2401_14550 [Bacillus sp. (in: firmicutes)]